MYQCPNCKTPTGGPKWKVRSTIRWANQHGKCVKVFCDDCGQWSDVTFRPHRFEDVVVVKQPRKDDPRKARHDVDVLLGDYLLF